MQMATMTDLTKIFLSDNQFDGSIPALLQDLAQLSEFEVARNKLDGTIPEAFGHLHQLQNLDLSHNSFTGPIPAQVRKTKKKRWEAKTWKICTYLEMYILLCYSTLYFSFTDHILPRFVTFFTMLKIAVGTTEKVDIHET